MNTSKDRVIDFIGVLKDFFGSSNSISDEEKSEKELIEWKKANNVSDKNIIIFEEMLKHNDKAKAKNRQEKRMKLVNESKTKRKTAKTEILDYDTEVQKISNDEKEQGRGAQILFENTRNSNFLYFYLDKWRNYLYNKYR